MKKFVLPACIALAVFSLALSAPAGERGMRVLRAGAESINVPLPDLGGSMAPVRHGNDHLEYRGRVMGASVDASAEIDGRSMNYQSFAELKAGSLRRPTYDTTYDGAPVRLSDPKIVTETLHSLVVSYTASPSGPQRRGPGGPDRRGSPGPDQVCFGHVYLYARHLVLTLTADRDTRGNLENAMRDWVEQTLRANRKGVDDEPYIELPLPGPGDLKIPFPAGLEAYSLTGGQRAARLHFFDPRLGPAGRTAAVTLMNDRQLSQDDFRRMAPTFDRDFLRLPQATRDPRSRDGAIRFSFSDDKRAGFTYTVVALLRDRPVRFDVIVPFGDRRAREWADQTLDSWVKDALELNRPGHRRPGAFTGMGPGPQIHPGPATPPAPPPAPAKPVTPPAPGKPPAPTPPAQRR